MDCGPPDQLPPCFLNLNWEQSMEPSGHLESALGSIVSSSSSNSPAAAEGLVLRNLVEKMASVGNSGEEISPQSHYMGTPLRSPPKLNLSVMGHLRHNPQGGGGLPVPGNLMAAAHLDQFTTDPGFAERAARFSCFDGRNYSGFPGLFGLLETGKLSRASSSQSPKASRSEMGVSESSRPALMPEGRQLEANDAEIGSAKEESSVSDPISASRDASLRGPAESNSKKRKAAPKNKAKDATLSNSTTDPPKATGEEDTNAKRCRSAGDDGAEKDTNKPKVEQNGGANTTSDGSQKQGKESNAKAPEPPKDYIHVRARRGQATDSHSLAERVRREKISQRMKLLQDLVPGCNKVTGKAVMLDEIINYVQSLQRQVEFLSMKLATVNPQLDFSSVANLLSKDIHQTCGPLPSSGYPLETSGSALLYANQPQQGAPLHSAVTSCQDTLSMQQPFLNGFGDALSQLGSFWEDDLNSVVQMNVGQNQEIAVSSQSIHGPLHTAHMKLEL